MMTIHEKYSEIRWIAVRRLTSAAGCQFAIRVDRRPGRHARVGERGRQLHHQRVRGLGLIIRAMPTGNDALRPVSERVRKLLLQGLGIRMRELSRMAVCPAGSRPW